MSPEARAAAGVFLAFQYPVEIPGVSTINFLKTAVNQIRKQKGKPALHAVKFLALLQEKVALMNMDESLLRRSLNDNFSMKSFKWLCSPLPSPF